MRKKNIPNQLDELYMRRALSLALAAKGKTFPNPAVGAVVVDQNGAVAGTGATGSSGRPHAETVALAKAKCRAAGGTIYVTLEPCCHTGKTPPCTRAIIAAGITRAVVAVIDPNPLMAGKGVAALRKAGITVMTGLCAPEAALLNEDFFFAIKNRRAFITLKLALTLCGRIADSVGNSQWITGEAARVFAHEIRRRSAAVAVGRGTLTADDPHLTVRHVAGYSPGRIVFVSSPKQIPRSSYFARHTKEARSVAVIRGAGKQRIIIDNGIEYWYTGKNNPAASLKAFAKMAFENDLTSVMVEGGSRLASGFLEAGLVNRLYCAFGSKIIGKGLAGISFNKGLGINKCIRLKNIKSMVVDDTVVITGIPYKS